ncbi:MAG: LysR family transcriptional regulator [Lachnospiraceae bacterium]|nr:LysR family transcriptional regulator [Lachnospiraceae bacterium]
MTFGQIKCFVTVVNEQSFAKAATTLYISQPAVSKSVAKLEEELGLTLLDRHGGELQLTPAGRTLYDFFVKMKNDYQDTLASVRQFASASMQTVRLGCPVTWNPDFFYDLLIDHFHSSKPSVSLEIEGFLMSDLFSRLQSGKLDFILTYESQRPLQYGYSVLQVAETSCGLLYSKQHYGDAQSLSDLQNADILIFNSQQIEDKFSKTIKRVCNSYGSDPDIKSYNSFISALFRMSCGKGAMLITKWENVEAATRFGYIPLPNYVPINLVYKESGDKQYLNQIADEIASLFRTKHADQNFGESTPNPFFF